MKTRVEYSKLEGFEEVYLEDSYILCLIQRNNEIYLKMLLVLTENHPLYTAPNPSEQYCYRNGEIRFVNVKSVIWHELDFHVNIDSNNEIDFGNIDVFYYDQNQKYYYLEGEFGKVEIKSDPPIVVILG